MNFLQLEWVQWIIGLVAVLITMWVIPNAWWAKFISLFGTKVSPIMDKIAKGLDGAGALAEGAGLDKLSTIAYELSDVIDEAEDVPRMLAEFTADGDLTKEELAKILEEVGEVAVEGKDFYIKVFKKPPVVDPA